MTLGEIVVFSLTGFFTLIIILYAVVVKRLPRALSMVTAAIAICLATASLYVGMTLISEHTYHGTPATMSWAQGSGKIATFVTTDASQTVVALDTGKLVQLTASRSVYQIGQTITYGCLPASDIKTYRVNNEPLAADCLETQIQLTAYEDTFFSQPWHYWAIFAFILLYSWPAYIGEKRREALKASVKIEDEH